MSVSGKTFGIVGALNAFPRRLAAREVERQLGQLRRGATRQTTHVVIGRSLILRLDDAAVEARVDVQRAAGRRLLSENGFLDLLGLVERPADSAMSRQSLIDQSKLSPRHFDFLTLFDAFEHDAEPFSFRDLILARKYAGLIAGGATWGAIARSIHRSGSVASLTALSLHAHGQEVIYARLGESLSELDGQRLLPLDEEANVDPDEIFSLAEAAEAEGRYLEAAAEYQRCLAIDASDSVAAFNRANCLRFAGSLDEAAAAYLLALKIDPNFSEAWFNSAVLLTDRGNIEGARRHFLEAIARDSGYGDAIYNLATLEYNAGDLIEARRWWNRYLEIDQESEWARTAARGVQYVDLHFSQRNAG